MPVTQNPILRKASPDKAPYRGFAMTQMGILKDYMKTAGLNVFSRVVTLANGVVITCKVCFNREDIEIYVPPVVATFTKGVTEVVKQTVGFLLQYTDLEDAQKVVALHWLGKDKWRKQLLNTPEVTGEMTRYVRWRNNGAVVQIKYRGLNIPTVIVNGLEAFSGGSQNQGANVNFIDIEAAWIVGNTGYLITRNKVGNSITGWKLYSFSYSPPSPMTLPSFTGPVFISDLPAITAYVSPALPNVTANYFRPSDDGTALLCYYSNSYYEVDVLISVRAMGTWEELMVTTQLTGGSAPISFIEDITYKPNTSTATFEMVKVTNHNETATPPGTVFFEDNYNYGETNFNEPPEVPANAPPLKDIYDYTVSDYTTLEGYTETKTDSDYDNTSNVTADGLGWVQIVDTPPWWRFQRMQGYLTSLVETSTSNGIETLGRGIYIKGNSVRDSSREGGRTAAGGAYWSAEAVGRNDRTMELEVFGAVVGSYSEDLGNAPFSSIPSSLDTGKPHIPYSLTQGIQSHYGRSCDIVKEDGTVSFILQNQMIEDNFNIPHLFSADIAPLLTDVKAITFYGYL